MNNFRNVIYIIFEQLITSDFIFKHKSKSIKNGIEFGSEETKKFCEVELNYLAKERISKTASREKANYFIGLSHFFEHSISPSYFKKLYPYINIQDGKAYIQGSMLKKLNSTNNSFRILILFALALIAIVLIASLKRGDSLLIPFFSIIMLFFIFTFSSLIIRKNELDEFKQKTEKYNNILS